MSIKQFEFSIRDAMIEDALPMAWVSTRAWEFAYSGFLPPEFMASRADPNVRAARIRDTWNNEGHRLVGISPENQVIGFAVEHRPCSLEAYDSEIGGLYVDPAASRSGVGRALVSEMARRFIAEGHGSMAIHTLSDNAIGCAFYEKLGGKPGPNAIWQGFSSKWYVWPILSESF